MSVRCWVLFLVWLMKMWQCSPSPAMVWTGWAVRTSCLLVPSDQLNNFTWIFFLRIHVKRVLACKTFRRVKMILKFSFSGKKAFPRSLICVSFNERKVAGIYFFSWKHSVDVSWCFHLSGCFTYFHNKYRSDHIVGLDDCCMSFTTEPIY